MTDLSPPSSEGLLDWAERCRLAVVEQVEETFRRSAADETQLRLFELTRPVLTRRAPPRAYCPAMHLPFFTCVAAGGSEDDAVRLATATTLLELAMDLIDYVWDEETDQTWPGEDPRVIELTGILLMAAVVPLAFAQVPAPIERIAALRDTVAKRLLHIAAGELADVRTFGRSDVTLAEAIAATMGKTGERRALYTVLGAQLAGAAPEAVEAFDAMGRHYGFARQIASDLVDVLGGGHSRDLASGSRTWPIAWMLAQLAGEERAAFVSALDRARTDPAAVQEVRACAERLGAGVRGLVEVELACRRALAALARTSPAEPAASALRAMIAVASLGRPAKTESS